MTGRMRRGCVESHRIHRVARGVELGLDVRGLRKAIRATLRLRLYKKSLRLFSGVSKRSARAPTLSISSQTRDVTLKSKTAALSHSIACGPTLLRSPQDRTRHGGSLSQTRRHRAIASRTGPEHPSPAGG